MKKNIEKCKIEVSAFNLESIVYIDDPKNYAFCIEIQALTVTILTFYRFENPKTTLSLHITNVKSRHRNINTSLSPA